MKPNNRITYRFDHKGHQAASRGEQEEKTAMPTVKPLEAPYKSNIIPLKQHAAANVIDDVHPWDKPLHDDIGALEQLIRESDRETKQNPAPSRTTRKHANDTDSPQPVNPNENWHKQGDVNSRMNNEQGWSNDEVRWPNNGPLWSNDEDRWPNNEHLWSNDEQIPPNDEAYREGSYVRESNGPSWFNVFLSVAGALATGALFGYLILSLFTGASLWPGGAREAGAIPVSSGAGNDATQNGLPGADADGVGGAQGGASGEANGAPVDGAGVNGEGQAVLPGGGSAIDLSNINFTYTMLQFGVFSTTEGRDAALEQLAGKGLASAVLDSGEGYRVYAGVAGGGSQAAALRSALPDLELYGKELTLHGPKQFQFGGEAELAQTFFQGTNDLMKSWCDLIAAQLEHSSLSPLGEASASAWQSRYGQWTNSLEAMKTAMAGTSGQSQLTKLEKSMESAAAAMQQYDKQPARSHLWKAQSALMDGVLTQKQWFETMSAL